MNRPTIPDQPPADLDAMSTQAWEAHVALLQHERAHPDLRLNPYWQALKDSAHARFRAAFEKGAQQ